jgi:membrane protein DedA with SNARE-associated domain
MTLGSLIEEYGYWLLAADSLLEGQTILVLAGFAARRGRLSLFAVLGIAAVASFVGNQFYFWLGRMHGPSVLVRWPSMAQQFDRIYRLFAHYPATVIVGIRFVYGLRIAGPVVIGMSPISGSRFALLNGVGAGLWAFVVTGIGWVFGHAAELIVDEMGLVAMWLVLGLVVVGGIMWWTKRKRLHRLPD